MIGLNTLTIYSIHLGFGKHFQQAKVPLSTFLRNNFIQENFYNIGLTMAKLSVVLFYARCFGSVKPSFRVALFATALVVVAWGVIFTFFFSCTPVRRVWDLSVPGHCIDFSGLVLGSAISNVVIDLILLLLPLPMLWRLQMSIVRKASLTIAFALGYW